MKDGHNSTVGYTYDLAGRPITITYPSGLGSVTRGYDDANRLTSVRDWLNNLTTFEYNDDGDLTAIARPNGADTLLGRDAAGQVITMTHAVTSTPFLSFTYDLDPVGVLTYTGEADLSGPVADHDYDYDSLYRLTTDLRSAAGTDTSTWDYDAATQIVTATYQQGEWGIPVVSTRKYNAANQLTSLEEHQGYDLLRYSAFTFDQNGNRTLDEEKIADETTTYTYDEANRLTSYFKSTTSLWGGPTEYTYNGDGLRSSKGGMFVVNSYTWDVGVQAGLPLLLEELGAAYIYGPGGILLESVQGASTTDVHYYHQDRLGSVRALTNSSGQVEATYEYDAYGKMLSSTGSVYNPFGYTGEYTDSESGLVYLRARYYDPSTQQFLTVDPALSWTEQAYAYVGGRPTLFGDSLGQSEDCGPFEQCPGPAGTFITKQDIIETCGQLDPKCPAGQATADFVVAYAEAFWEFWTTVLSGGIPGNKGQIIERERPFTPQERRIAEVLKSEGKTVESQKARDIKWGDAKVNGELCEFKTLKPGATSGTIKNRVDESIHGLGQARNIILDVRGTGMSSSEALRGLKRAVGISRGKVDTLRVIGDGYDHVITIAK